MEKDLVKVKKNAIKKTKGERIAFVIAFAVFAVYSLSIALSVIWLFYNSLKPNTLEWVNDKISLPSAFTWSNYRLAFSAINYRDVNFFGMFLNSIWFAGGMSALSVLMHALTGYAFAKYRFLGKEAAFSFIVFTIMLPVVGTLPSFYRIVTKMSLTESPLFLVTALGGFGGNFLIMYAYFKGIDWSYAEAAFIDGAGHYLVLFKIMMRMALTPMFALFLVGFIGQWNNYEQPMLFLDTISPLSSGLYRFYLGMVRDTTGKGELLYFAGVIMSMIPVLVLVSIFGGKIMKNISTGGLKG